MDCVFCKIIKGEIPCYKIYEDEFTLAFLDIAKDVDGHTLVIPKKHYVSIFDCDKQELNHVMQSVQKISKHYTEHCGFDGINLLNANDETAGQSVFHFHIHIIPRRKNDKVNFWPQYDKANHSLDEMKDMLKLSK